MKIVRTSRGVLHAVASKDLNSSHAEALTASRLAFADIDVSLASAMQVLLLI